MLPADRVEFVKILNGLEALKPGAKITPEALDLWWGAMADWDLEEFRQAANHLAKSSEFMPNPFHFEQLRKAGRMTAAEAWNRAKDACGSAVQCGRITNRGNSGDELIDRVVRAIGGYGVIYLCESDKLHFLERRFCEHYETLQESEDVRQALSQIAGPGPTLALESEVSKTRQTVVRAIASELAHPSPPESVPDAKVVRFRPAPSRARPTKTAEELKSDARKLAAAGLESEQIAKMLGQYGVMEGQAREWLSEPMMVERSGS